MKFDAIESQRIILKPFCAEYITPTYIGWLNDPEVVRYSVHRHIDYNKESCENFLLQMREAGSIFAAILLKQDNSSQRHVGNTIANIDAPNGTADMTIMLGERDVWGKGMGSEAWASLMNFLLNDGGMRKITAGAVEHNEAMLSIMRRTGMHEEARRRRQYIVDGKEVDLIYFARFAT